MIIAYLLIDDPDAVRPGGAHLAHRARQRVRFRALEHGVPVLYKSIESILISYKKPLIQHNTTNRLITQHAYPPMVLLQRLRVAHMGNELEAGAPQHVVLEPFEHVFDLHKNI